MAAAEAGAAMGMAGTAVRTAMASSTAAWDGVDKEELSGRGRGKVRREPEAGEGDCGEPESHRESSEELTH